MRRNLVCLSLGIGLSLFMVSHGLAESSIKGFIRTTMVKQSDVPEPNTDATDVIDNRFRVKWTNELNSNVKWVYYGEVDTTFGEYSKQAEYKTEIDGENVTIKSKIGNGGKAGADGVNLETKNVYLDFSVPDTAFAARLGIQGYDAGYDGMLFADDAAGIKLTAKLEMADINIGYFNLDEGERTSTDDEELYFLNASVNVNDSFKITPSFYYHKDHAQNFTDNYLGLRADYNSDSIGLTAWALMRMGTQEADPDDIDHSGFVCSLKVSSDVLLDSTTFSGQFLYFSADDDAEDDTKMSYHQGDTIFPDANLMIFLQDKYYTNVSGGRRAVFDASDEGYGLMGFVLNYIATFGNMYARIALGHFMAVDDQAYDDNNGAMVQKEGTTLGTEVATAIGIKVAEVVDVSIRSAFAFLGDFYDAAPGAGDDPDDLYKFALMTNVSF